MDLQCNLELLPCVLAAVQILFVCLFVCEVVDILNWVTCVFAQVREGESKCGTSDKKPLDFKQEQFSSAMAANQILCICAVTFSSLQATLCIQFI